MQRGNLMRTVATSNDPLLNPSETTYESDGESMDDCIREKSEEELPVLMDLIIEDYLGDDEPRPKSRSKATQKRISEANSRMSFLQKMKTWKEDLWGSVGQIDRVLTKKAEEKQRELSEGDKTLEEFKDKFMPTKEACEVVLDPKYEGNCLGADMNKLACEPLLVEAPSVWKEVVSDKVPAAMEEVINLSSNMLNDCLEQAIDDERAQELERVRIKKFFEFYKSHRERRLRMKMEQLKQEMVQDTSNLVQDACKDALATQVLQQTENIHGSKETYHKLIEGSLPMVPLEAARNIQQRFTEIVGKAIGAIDEMQEEILEQNSNYNNLVNKLKEMVIQDPPVKRTRQEYVEEAEEEPSRKYKRTTTVRSLTDLCIATCAEYVEYLPELPEGCFPEELIQKLLTLLVQQNKMDDLTLEKLLNPSILSLSLVHSQQIFDSSMKAVATRCVFLRKLNMRDCINITNHSVYAIASGCVDLELLDIEGCIGVDDEGVRAIARKCSGLKSISLSQCPKITDAAVQELIYRCHGLTSLNLRKCPQITDGSFGHVGVLQELVSVDLSDCTQITDRTLVNLSKCNKLRCLKVMGNKSQISDNGVCALAQSCADLRVLELTACDISDKSVRYISASCPYLKRLGLAFCKKITDAAFQFDSAIFGSPQSQDIPFPGIPVHLENEGSWRRSSNYGGSPFGSLSGSWGSRSGGFQVKAQSNFYNLQHLDLTRCLSIGDKTLEQLANYCPNLKSLYLNACEEVTDAGLHHLVRSRKGVCRNLRRLSLSKCRRVTDAALMDITRQAGENLRVLSLENCYLITDCTVISVAQHCPNLEELDLSSCERVGDDAVKNLMLGCRKLRSVSFEELTNLTEEGISALTNACRLKTLRLGYCKGLTNECLRRIVAACPDITNLDLSYCNNPKFTLEGLQEVLPQWEELTVLNLRGINSFTTQAIAHPNLQTLNLSWCKYMQDEALEGIAVGCPRLSNIDLAWCSKVTGSAVHRLAQRSQSLKSFNLRGCRVPNITIQFLTHAGKMVYK